MPETTLPSVPAKEAEALKSKLPSIVEAAQKFAVKSDEDVARARAFEDGIDEFLGKVHELWDEKVELAFRLHRSLTASRKEMAEPAEKAKRLVHSKAEDYGREQLRLAREEQARKEREAREQAEREQLAMAEQAEAAGDRVEAEKILEREPFVPPPPVEKPKLAGFSAATTKKGEIVDAFALCRAIADNVVPLSVIKAFDQALIDKEARKLGEKLNWPGVRVYDHDSLRRS